MPKKSRSWNPLININLDLALGEYIGAAIKDAYYSGYRAGLEQNK